MKTAFRSILAIVALAIFTVSTATVQAEDYLYETNNGTITITGYTGPGGDVTIPDTISGLPVIAIRDQAFYRCNSLTSVTIPNSVISIGWEAFASCWGLTSITIPDSVTSIERSTFHYCTNLTNVTIGNSVTSIGDYAFLYCYSLANITIPNSVTHIGEDAFDCCSSLTSVTLPNSVTTIGHRAFFSCDSLTNATIGTGLTNIEVLEFGFEGGPAFMFCSSLIAITVDPLNSSYASPDGVLFGKNQTRLIQYPGGKTGSYSVPNSVTSIEDWAFVGCIGLTSITIPDGVTSIGGRAFLSCTSLTGVYFKGNAPTLGPYAFEGATNAIVYYLSGSTGWDTTFGERPTAPWLLPYPVILTTAPNFGIQTNAFGFRISWATNASVVVEATADLSRPSWDSVSTNTLVDGWSDFRDAEWTKYPARFYRVRQR